MTTPSDASLADASLADAALAGHGASPRAGLAALRQASARGAGALARLYAQAFEQECAQRRLFLWLPVCVGAGAVLHLGADREPSLPLLLLLACAAVLCARLARERRFAFILFCAAAAVFAGGAASAWRTARVAAPVLTRTTVAEVEGFVEQMDFRRSGARFVLRVSSVRGLAPGATPYRLRLTLRRAPPFEAGTYVKLKARLLPPSRASLPGGYDFARDAFFARIGGVGNALGRVEAVAPPRPMGLGLALSAALDRGRNALSRRIDAVLGGDAGAIAAAMVTGKRDLLSEEARETIREAGVFHIITIAGVQMTLVAGIFFVGFRRLLALSPTLALRYPIKKWAALAAMGCAIFYDLATGSRVGTERALVMTLIMLGAALFDAQAFTMRNLAFAALFVALFEPDALLGASFQLSFAAVAGLVAVYEGRMAARAAAFEEARALRVRPPSGGNVAAAALRLLREKTSHGVGGALFATFCATAATTSFMTYHFHEFSPYVLIGNPLTLTAIEFFAVPGALLGTALYPLGLDGPVWRFVGFGVDLVMGAARIIGALPGASLHLPAFAPWSLPFLALAVLCATLWRTWAFRLLSLPLLALGVAGALSGPRHDLIVAADGSALAYRGADGKLSVLAARPSLFAVEQWLRADADARPPAAAVRKEACDRTACVGRLADARAVSLVVDRAAFAEDCQRADVIVTPLFAPTGCAAPLVIDRDGLRQTGALAFRLTPQGLVPTPARAPGEDRPWSPAPPRRWGVAERAPAPRFMEEGAEPTGFWRDEGAASLQLSDSDDGAPPQ
ncbi:ComEC/Rec2 family competence protein [Methylocella sp.]|uniref:ComEC/Rec2 family competence protein n=1 Tax=Methylocella sp. TaxID=1978226 RepID=UPI003783910C